MKIDSANAEDYPELLDVWENSVRATHDFITEDDIAFFKPIIIEQAFPHVTLKCIKDEHKAILGFIGVHECKIEMLFILDAARGKGVGKALLNYAVDQLAANKVSYILITWRQSWHLVKWLFFNNVCNSKALVDLNFHLLRHRLVSWADKKWGVFWQISLNIK